MAKKNVTGKEGRKSFTVGNVFRHQDENCVLQYHYDNFINWLIKPVSGRVIPISKAKGKISEYVLIQDMDDLAIHKATKSTHMEIDQFFAILYLLIIEPELGREHLDYELRKDEGYILHVRLKPGKVVAVYVNWDDDEWDLDARELDCDGRWLEHSVFLFLS